MGESTAKLLSIMLAIATSRSGFVLIDELENGVHYSVHSKLWPLLITFSKRYDCQLFLTTHSYELIKSLKDAVAEKDDEYLSYVRLDRTQDNILPKTYHLDMLFSAIERDWEIR
jgi:AAA15 family ATPase/GTPase